MFTWTPFYKELAKTLLGFRKRQPDLVQILTEIKNNTDIPIIRLVDAPQPATAPILSVIDPFTFFATFNRGLRDQNRIGIIKIIKEKLHLQSDIPTDFNGIPVVDNMQSWFFPYAFNRQADDISSLWDLAESIISNAPEQLNPELFNRCLEVHTVGPAKLTMGLFWMNPDNYLALDEKNTSYFASAGITTKVTDHATYISLMGQVREKLGTDFTQISRSAWETATQEIQYWAGGSTWGSEKKADEFVKGNFWQIGWDQDDDESAAKKTWAAYPNIKIGDEFAIKGLGGRYDLVVYYVGKVISKSEDGILKLQKLDRPLFRGKGPQGSNWFDTIVPVTNKAAIDAVFYGKTDPKEPALAAPFNEFFASFKEANQGFDLIKETLVKFGVNPAESENDGRISLTLVGKRNRMRLNFADWAVLTFNPLTRGDKRLDFMCIKKLIPAASQDTESDFEFSDTIDGQQFGSGTCAVAVLHEPESEENHVYLQSLELAAKRFKNSKGSRWAMNHEPPVLQMVFDTELRQKLLKEGLNPAEKANGENNIATTEPLHETLNIILYGPPGTGKTYKLRTEYMDKFTDRQSVLSGDERAAALVKDLSWWEVVALALLDTKEKRASVAQILAHRLVEARIKLSSNNNPRAMIWAALQIHTKEECQNVKYTSRSQPLIFEKDNESVWSIDAGLADTILPGLKVTLNEYHHPAENGKIEQKRFEFVTFHQSFSYEDFIEGIKPEITDSETAATNGQISYRVEPGIFKKMCRQALAQPGKKFAILIDEINRGNVASIFGELITLIEEDKRLKEPNELMTKLPYSREQFGVPNNLYIIGTMNTADRSVEALDTALRRRFTFIEMRPNPEKVTQPDGLKVDLRKIFEVINARIERLHDADHCIGHAYFMGVKDLAGLRSVFANKIIPLLREYFYGNPAKVGMVLGERFVKRKSDNAPFATGSWGFDELDQKEVFTFTDPSDFSEEDFQTIYAKNGTGI